MTAVAAWRWEASGEGVGLWRLPAWADLGAGVVFSSRMGGRSPAPWEGLNVGLAVGDAPDRVQENRRRLAVAAGVAPESVAQVHQVHGTAVAQAVAPGDVGTADALCTDRVGVTLSVGVADCAAIYFLDPVHGAIALCHAGWRGTVGDAVGATVRTMAGLYGTRAGELHAAIGPAIGPCCYEVDAPVLDALRGAAAWADSVLVPTDAGYARLDLWESNRRRLLDQGVAAERITVAGLCTACHPDLLFSHRRDRGSTGRMRALLWRLP